ncbi:MAG TPA: hypothetical protein VMT58_06590, partial [Candidatus Binataceae bacterium]|nr:hypothetical protein [Candidatus Binataceae bacterium]
MPETNSYSLPRNVPRSGAWIAAILATTAAVYARSLGNEFVYDDHFWIDNPHLGNWSFLWQSFSNNLFWFHNSGHSSAILYYRPVQTAWFLLCYHLFGRNPALWHAASIGLHLIVSFLVYRVASSLASDQVTGLIAAALFALLPIHAEAVIWVAAASYPLSAALELAAFDFYLR